MEPWDMVGTATGAYEPYRDISAMSAKLDRTATLKWRRPSGEHGRFARQIGLEYPENRNAKVLIFIINVPVLG